MLYYSKSTRGFYEDTVHGAPTIKVVDPAWARPTTTIPDPEWVRPTIEVPSAENPDILVAVPDEAAVHPVIEVADASAVPDYIEIDNPACVIPKDAVQITEEQRKELLAAEAAGKVIDFDKKGQPIARELTAAEKGASRKREIFGLLAELDARSPRAMREAVLTGDTTRLQAIEAEAATLREELATL